MVALTRGGLGKPEAWNSFTPRFDIIWNCSAVSPFSHQRGFWRIGCKLHQRACQLGLEGLQKSSLMKEARGIQLA